MQKQIGILILLFFLLSCSQKEDNNDMAEAVEKRIDFSVKKDNLDILNIDCDEYLSLSEEEKKGKLQLYMKCSQFSN